MENKTCKDCRYMLHKDTFEVCTLCMTETAMFNTTCEHFTGLTKGDKIRAMNDEELADTIDELAFKFSNRQDFIDWLQKEVKDE